MIVSLIIIIIIIINQILLIISISFFSLQSSYAFHYKHFKSIIFVAEIVLLLRTYLILIISRFLIQTLSKRSFLLKLNYFP